MASSRGSCRSDDYLKSALTWLATTTLAAFVVVVAAIACGFRVSFSVRESVLAAAMIGGTAGTAVLSRSFVPRISTAVGAFSALTFIGAVAGVLSMVGQMFALPLVDGALAAADRFIGIQTIDVVRFIVQFPGAPVMLAMVYELSVPLIFVSALALACLGRHQRVWELCAAFGFCLFVATITSVLFPAAGPFEFSGIAGNFADSLPAGAGVYHLKYFHALRGTPELLIDPMHPKGLVTFPSFHTAMALMTAAAWRTDRYLRGPMIVWNAAVILSAVPIGGHYIIDIAAGAAVWFVIFRFGPSWTAAIRAPAPFRQLDAQPA